MSDQEECAKCKSLSEDVENIRLTLIESLEEKTRLRIQIVELKESLEEATINFATLQVFFRKEARKNESLESKLLSLRSPTHDRP